MLSFLQQQATRFLWPSLRHLGSLFVNARSPRPLTFRPRPRLPPQSRLLFGNPFIPSPPLLPLNRPPDSAGTVAAVCVFDLDALLRIVRQHGTTWFRDEPEIVLTIGNEVLQALDGYEGQTGADQRSHRREKKLRRELAKAISEVFTSLGVQAAVHPVSPYSRIPAVDHVLRSLTLALSQSADHLQVRYGTDGHLYDEHEGASTAVWIEYHSFRADCPTRFLCYSSPILRERVRPRLEGPHAETPTAGGLSGHPSSGFVNRHDNMLSASLLDLTPLEFRAALLQRSSQLQLALSVRSSSEVFEMPVKRAALPETALPGERYHHESACPAPYTLAAGSSTAPRPAEPSTPRHILVVDTNVLLHPKRGETYGPQNIAAFSTMLSVASQAGWRVVILPTVLNEVRKVDRRLGKHIARVHRTETKDPRHGPLMLFGESPSTLRSALSLTAATTTSQLGRWAAGTLSGDPCIRWQLADLLQMFKRGELNDFLLPDDQSELQRPLDPPKPPWQCSPPSQSAGWESASMHEEYTSGAPSSFSIHFTFLTRDRCNALLSSVLDLPFSQAAIALSPRDSTHLAGGDIDARAAQAGWAASVSENAAHSLTGSTMTERTKSYATERSGLPHYLRRTTQHRR